MSEEKQRHGCLTAYLIYLIIWNIWLLIDYVRDFFSTGVELLVILYFSVFLLSLYSLIALLKWKKWGYWGYVASVITISILGQSTGELPWFYLFIPLIGIIILYGVLHIGKENKGWAQLE